MDQTPSLEEIDKFFSFVEASSSENINPSESLALTTGDSLDPVWSQEDPLGDPKSVPRTN